MTKFKPLACGFHSHTDVGSLDGGSTPESKIIRADKLGRIADCVTDHGTMNALAQHWFASQKLYKDKKLSNKIKSIHGIEAYIVDDIRGPKIIKTRSGTKTEPRYMHLTIHFKTAAAYKYFCSLTPKMESRAIVKYGESKPLLLMEELEPISGQITIGSGCLVGVVMKSINDWDMNEIDRLATAEKQYLRLRELAGPGNFFVEVFPHSVKENWVAPKFDKKNKKKLIEAGKFKPILEKNHVCGTHCDGLEHFMDECGHKTVARDLQKTANQFVIAMARKYGDPLIISEDSHFASPEDQIIQEVRLGNGEEKWKFSNSYHMADSDEWAKNLKDQLGVSDRDIEEMIDNSYRFVDLFGDYKLETSNDRILMPTMEMVYGIQGISTKEKFWELAKKHGKMPDIKDPKYTEYKKRADYELSVLCDNKKADFLPYFFVLEDAAEFARANGITFTCRGSAGGSLVMFLLNISIMDPIEYDLPFERFITEGRIDSGSLPDADTDWQNRDAILQYLSKKYGDKMALISTNTLLRLKSSIKDAERVELGSVRRETEILLKQIKGAGQGQTDKDWLFGYIDKSTGDRVPGFWDDKDDPLAAELRNYATQNKKIWDTAMRCIGITRNKGVHAGGVIIMPDPVQNHFPVILTDQGFVTAYEMKAVENCGGVKYDFLSLDALDSAGISMKAIEETTGNQMVWKEFPYDSRVFSEVIESGKLAGIFQLNTQLVKPYILRIKPKSIKECAITTALIRPGALDAPSPDPSDPYTGARTGSDQNIHAAEYFVRCREGKKKPYYIHQDLEPILGETYGVIVYQEQSLQIFRDLAGYSYAEAEEVRRAIGKKIKELLEKHLGVLKTKCLERGWSESQADRLNASLVASANYCFNKSHSCAYAMVAYNEAYLKFFHPKAYWKGKLAIGMSKAEKFKAYLAECEVPIYPVDITKSLPVEWTIDGDGLRPPLSVIKKCGATTVSNLRDMINMPIDKFLSKDIKEEEELVEDPEVIVDDVG